MWAVESAGVRHEGRWSSVYSAARAEVSGDAGGTDGGGVRCVMVVQRRYPKAQVFVAPGQWSWPLNLPPSFFGIFNSQPLTDDNRGASLPFADEFECEILRPRPIGVNASVKFNEAALFHKPTKTLLVTDAVVHVVCFLVRRFPRPRLTSHPAMHSVCACLGAGTARRGPLQWPNSPQQSTDFLACANNAFHARVGKQSGG